MKFTTHFATMEHFFKIMDLATKFISKRVCPSKRMIIFERMIFKVVFNKNRNELTK